MPESETMPRTLHFTKLEALGNDFVLVDDLSDSRDPSGVLPRLSPKVLRQLGDRKLGIGYDQLLLLTPSSRTRARLDIFNTDGSRAEMCGNGLRAAALYVWKVLRANESVLLFETAAGDRVVRRLGEDGNMECEMGCPVIHLPDGRSSYARQQFLFNMRPVRVSVGNPHAVVFVRRPLSRARCEKFAHSLQVHRAFPRGTNVEFVRVVDAHRLDVQVWERGVGWTDACGTGAVATAVAAIQTGRATSSIEVRFSGGNVEVVWDGPGKQALLRGSARLVFHGEVEIE